MLVRIHAQILDFWQAKTCKGIGPDLYLPRRTLFAEDDLPCSLGCCPRLQVVEPHRDELAVVIEVEELVTCPALLLPCDVRQLVVTIEVNFKGLSTYAGPFEQTLLDICIACGRQKRGEPVETGE